MRHRLVSLAKNIAVVVGMALPLLAQAAESGAGSCEQIVAVCSAAGFVKGDARQGHGLWVDCVNPIMRGAPQPPKAEKPLPPVSPDLLAACRQKHPNFGESNKGPGR
jgi:hypothetical protein